jgi:cell shape-determining protein MreC
MPNFRLNHVFAALMLVSFFAAFVIPPKFTNPARGELQGIFSPVSRPVRGIAGFVYRRISPTVQTDDGSPTTQRTDETVLEENRKLRITLSNLTVKLDQLSQLNADRALIGDIRPLCKPATVTGVDSSALRESLVLSTPISSGFKADMPVLFAGGLVGKIARTGIGSATVRLITDPGFAVTGRIGQYKTDSDGKVKLECIEHLQPLVQGAGHGTMAIRGTISMQQVHDLNIAVNDMVVLDDRDWPGNIQGYWVGRIVAISPASNVPLFADIRVEPVSDLMKLNEVMVMGEAPKTLNGER